jgi:hypothetical protein
MNKIFEEKSIKYEKNKLKKLLFLLKNIDKNNDKYFINDNKRKQIEKGLYNAGIKRIRFDNKWYYLNQEETTNIIKFKDNDANIVKFKDDDANIVKFKDNDTNQQILPTKNVSFLPNRGYNVNDIVNIVTPNSKFKSVYMGIEGLDAQDILDKLNPQFDKSDPFDGVFVLFTDKLPMNFIKKGIRIFLLNENDVGKSKQIVKAYTNDGKYITKYKVTIKKIELVKKQNMPHRIAASLNMSVGLSILEKINTNKFQEFLNKRNESVINFSDFNTSIDFEEIK